MNIIYVFDQDKAEFLQSLGFKYTERNIDGKKTYRFLGTEKLMESLNSKFDKSDFLVRKNMCF